MYTIDEERFETAEDTAQYIIDHVDLIDEYDEMLDGSHEDIDIGGYSFTPSDALRKLDEVAYSRGYFDFVDVTYSNLVYEFECMSDGDAFLTYEFEVVYTEEELE